MLENETSNWIIHWYEVEIWNFSFFNIWTIWKSIHVYNFSCFHQPCAAALYQIRKILPNFFQIITNTPNDTAIYIWLVSIFEFISLQNDLLQTSIESVISLHIYQFYLKNVFKYIWVACFVLMCLSTRFFNNVEVDNH